MKTILLFLLISVPLSAQDYCYMKIGETGHGKHQFDPSLECLENYINKPVLAIEKVLPVFKVLNVIKQGPKNYQITYKFNCWTRLRIQVTDSINGKVTMISLLDIAPEQWRRLIMDALKNGYRSSKELVYQKEGRTLYLFDTSEQRYCVSYY